VRQPFFQVSSISTTNTLLVSGDKKDKKGLNLNIDPRQIYDPDAIWRRSRQTSLTLGRVSELGRFQTDLEPEPDKKIGKYKTFHQGKRYSIF